MSISARIADAFAGQKRPDGREIRRIRHAFRRGLPAASMPPATLIKAAEGVKKRRLT
jgi:hypothetical protein